MCTPNGCLARTRTSLGAPLPLDSGERSKGEKPRAQKTRRGNEEVCSMQTHNPAHSRVSGNPGAAGRGSGSPLSRGRTESKTRAEQELAEQRRLAPVLREAHARLGLWRTCDDKTCRRGGAAAARSINAARASRRRVGP